MKPKPPTIRDRVVELRRVKASTLIPNEKNWRRHPPGQQEALRGVLADIGYADALLAREVKENGKKRLQLIDGHLRRDTTPDAVVPVLVLDVTEEEADKILATLDPLAAMAEADHVALKALLATVTTGDEGLKALLDSLIGVADLGASVAGYVKAAGEADDDEETLGWPAITMKVPQETKDRFDTALGAEQGDRPWKQLDALLARIEA